MNILGLFIVVFAVLATSRILGFTYKAATVGAVIGGGTYVLLSII